MARHRHDLGRARRLNDESIALFRELGDRWSLGQLLNNQACVLPDERDFDAARGLLVESLRIRRQLCDRAGLALSLNTLADVSIEEGDHPGAGRARRRRGRAGPRRGPGVGSGRRAGRGAVVELSFSPAARSPVQRVGTGRLTRVGHVAGL